MALQKQKTVLKEYLPNIEIGRFFFAKASIHLEEEHGFLPENTHFSVAGCSDEINEPEYLLMQQYWGERFKFGGLAGYCHGGRSSLIALSHHVPEIDGEKNLFLLVGPHIGYHEGEWGKVRRTGHDDASSSCGSLLAVLQAGYEHICKREVDPLDRQQQVIEELMLPYLKTCHEEERATDILEATQFLMQQINTDLLKIVADLESQFSGQIALITGITVNTEVGNFFNPSLAKVMSAGKHQQLM